MSAVTLIAITTVGIAVAIAVLVLWSLDAYTSRNQARKQDRIDLAKLCEFYCSVEQLANENRNVDPTAIKLDSLVRAYRKEIRANQ